MTKYKIAEAIFVYHLSERSNITDCVCCHLPRKMGYIVCDNCFNTWDDITEKRFIRVNSTSKTVKEFKRNWMLACLER